MQLLLWDGFSIAILLSDHKGNNNCNHSKPNNRKNEEIVSGIVTAQKKCPLFLRYQIHDPHIALDHAHREIKTLGIHG